MRKTLDHSVIEPILRADAKYASLDRALFSLPNYHPETHYIDLTESKYFDALLTLRHYVRAVSDYYFGVLHGGRNVDLFMLTPSVSSPMGVGSDSEAIPIKFGNLDWYLVDSSQFGFEPLLMNGLELVYCYLPSMRGEAADKRHLNQFFHCEAEMRGDISRLIPLVEGYVRAICEALSLMPNIVGRISQCPEMTQKCAETIINMETFQRISFDEAIELLKDEGGVGDVIEIEPRGREITPQGEINILKLLGLQAPLWIMNHDRDRVPFYQKPDPADSNKAVNGDLIFPPIVSGAFGGEIVGCGQRQDSVHEMFESLDRQRISAEPYQWYINLRRLPGYATTSGFGLGIERFIAWALCRSDIRDVIIYPRLKNVITYP